MTGGLYVEKGKSGNAFVWGAKKGKITWAGVVSAKVAASNQLLRNYARRTGL